MRAAAILASLISTCRRHDLDPQLVSRAVADEPADCSPKCTVQLAPGPVETASSATIPFVAPVLHIALTEILQYLQSIVEKGGLSRPPGRHVCRSYAVVWTLWKVETTVSKV